MDLIKDSNGETSVSIDSGEVLTILYEDKKFYAVAYKSGTQLKIKLYKQKYLTEYYSRNKEI